MKKSEIGNFLILRKNSLAFVKNCKTEEEMLSGISLAGRIKYLFPQSFTEASLLFELRLNFISLSGGGNIFREGDNGEKKDRKP